MDLKLSMGAAMFVNDKPSRNLCPPALDRDLLLGSHPYIWIKVLLQSANGLWTVWVLIPHGDFSIISQAHFQPVAPPAKLSRRFPVTRCPEPFDPIPRESQELHSDPIYISKNAVYEAETTDSAFHQGQETMECQNTDRAPWWTRCLLSGSRHSKTFQTFKQWLTARIAHANCMHSADKTALSGSMAAQRNMFIFQ